MPRKQLQKFKIKNYPTNCKPGKIYGAIGRSRDELACAELLSYFGENIYFQKESKISGVHTPDILWKYDGKFWEIKTLNGNSYANTAHAIAHASKQSANIILDARKTKRDIRRIIIDTIKYSGEPKTRQLQEVVILSRTEYCHLQQSMLQ